MAEVDGIEDRAALTASQKRQLVNKYPLFTAFYCAMRLELLLKAVVVPVFGAHAYVGVYEWSPTGGMVHLHYILWIKGAPRFDVRAEELLRQVAELRKAGLSCAGEVTCKVDDVISFFDKYITEWNENKTEENENRHDYTAADVNEAEPHPAALSTEAMLDLLRGENATARYEYYCRAVRKEHIHDFHFPNPLDPPNPAQPCARRLKGKLDVWYCGNAYPRDTVPAAEDQAVTQDALRPDLFRVGLLRNDPLMNPHCPAITFAAQSNDDAQPVITRHAAEMYACKYVTWVN